MRCWSYAAVLLAVAAGGCRNPDTGFNADVNRELTEINGSLKELAAKTTPGKIVLTPESAAEPRREISMLPGDPTDEEVAAYAKAIFDVVKDRHDFSSEDEYARLVKRIPPGHIAVLGDYLGNYYFQCRIPTWVRPEDKDIILAKLPDAPGLLPCLSYVPVTPEEVRPVLLQMLAKNPAAVDVWTLKGFYPILFDDAATREAMRRIVIERPVLFPVADALDQYEGRKELVPQMWEYAMAHQLEVPPSLVSRMARCGSVEALGRLTGLAIGDAPLNQYYRKTMSDQAPFLAEQADPKAFFDANRDRIVFDPEAKKFIIRENAK